MKKTKFMTVREVADSLNVSERAVQRCIRRINSATPGVAVIRVENRKKTLLSETQCALISKELKSNQNVTDQLSTESALAIKNTTTRMEIMANYKAATDAFVKMLESENAELKADNERLRVELDESKSYITIKRMEKLNPNLHFDWRILKKECGKLNAPAKDVFDANYGTVKAYPAKVWESLYFDSINYPED